MGFVRFADVILMTPHQELLLVRREVPVRGYALPGVALRDMETTEAAAVRGCRELLGRRVLLREEFHTYPFVDIYGAKVGETTVFLSSATEIANIDGASQAENRFTFSQLPLLISAHQLIVEDFLAWHLAGRRPALNAALPALTQRFAEKLAA